MEASTDTNSNKRTALAGQWRTPPTPFFPGTGEEETDPAPVTTDPAPVTAIGTSTTTLPVASLPSSTEDYAKALQEAYRRGAEAAARAAAQAQITTEPDTVQVPTKKPPPAIQPVAVPSSAVPQVPSAVVTSAPAIPGSGPLAPPTASNQPMQVQVQLVHHHHHHHNAATGTANPGEPPTLKSSAQQRSVSLPDMTSYAAQQEEEKRQKRLARNRASARLRRLRKKNLVDAYESEVGSLEKTIAQLKQHEWGLNANASALAEALSMDRGQQELTPAERCQAATDILTQQLQFLQQLEELMQEQFVLHQVARAVVAGESASEWKDLQDALQLSMEQAQSLVQQANGWEDEWNALMTVKSSLQAMKENDWLWNEGCSEISEQFLSILHKNQISKFLLWADQNAEAIEELDCVHPINTVSNAPVFQFGVDSNPNEFMDEGTA